MALNTVFLNADTTTLSIAVLVAGLLYSAYAYAFLRPAIPKNAPALTTEAWPIIGSMQFFTERWSFFQRQMAHSGSGNFSFFAGDKHVVGLSGDEARRVFFESKALGFTEGYASMLGGSPTVKKDNNPLAEDMTYEMDVYFQKRIIALLKGPLLAKGLPQLLADVRSRLDDLVAQPEHITDPFDSIYRIVFQLTMRTVACNEIARDPKLLDKTLGYYETIEGATSALNIMYPWLPTPSKVKRTYAGGKLYMLFKNVVDARRKEGRSEEDALQFLMDQGDNITQIITFVLGALFAGQLNSGINAAWILVYLTANQGWQDRIRQEVNSVADKYCSDKSLPLKERLMYIPIQGWEGEFPMTDLCLKDSIRLVMPGTAFRKNVSGREIVLDKAGKEVIPPEAFAAYAVADVHYDGDIYADPEEWDPSRYFPDRAEDKKKQYGWLGWGVSRHPCLGMRFAKLENNIITAFFLAYFDDLKLLDGSGQPMDKPPRSDKNYHSAGKPHTPVRLAYSVRKDGDSTMSNR